MPNFVHFCYDTCPAKLLFLGKNTPQNRPFKKKKKKKKYRTPFNNTYFTSKTFNNKYLHSLLAMSQIAIFDPFSALKSSQLRTFGFTSRFKGV